jgi:hypothetical protein
MIAACLVAGCSGSGTAESIGTMSGPLPTVVSCPSGNANSGSLDSAGDAEGVQDLREHASQWAQATGSPTASRMQG